MKRIASGFNKKNSVVDSFEKLRPVKEHINDGFIVKVILAFSFLFFNSVLFSVL